METKGTRIEISPDLHELIKNVYNDLKSRGAKNLTLKKVLEDLCNSGLEYQKLAQQGLAGGPHNEIAIKQPSVYPQAHVLESKDELVYLQRAILLHLIRWSLYKHLKHQIYNIAV